MLQLLGARRRRRRRRRFIGRAAAAVTATATDAAVLLLLLRLLPTFGSPVFKPHLIECNQIKINVVSLRWAELIGIQPGANDF